MTYRENASCTGVKLSDPRLSETGMNETMQEIRADEAALSARAADLRVRRDALAKQLKAAQAAHHDAQSRADSVAAALADALAAGDEAAAQAARKQVAAASQGLEEGQRMSLEAQAIQGAIDRLEGEMVAVEEQRRSLGVRERKAAVAFSDAQAEIAVARAREAWAELSEAVAMLAVLGEVTEAATGQPCRYWTPMTALPTFPALGLDRQVPMVLRPDHFTAKVREAVRASLAAAGFKGG